MFVDRTNEVVTLKRFSKNKLSEPKQGPVKNGRTNERLRFCRETLLHCILYSYIPASFHEGKVFLRYFSGFALSPN